MQPDTDPNDHYLATTPMVRCSGDVNVPANDVNGWERLAVDQWPSIALFLSTSCFLMILHLMNQNYSSTISLMKECGLPLSNKPISMQGVK